jgi:hypothetical protein
MPKITATSEPGDQRQPPLKDEDQDQAEGSYEECEPVGVGQVLDHTPSLFEEVARCLLYSEQLGDLTDDDR